MPKLLAAFILLFTSPLLAAPAFYAGAAVGVGDIKLSRTHFSSRAVQLHAGGWVSEGIGLELRLNQETRGDSERGIEVSIPRIATAALRFQSPEEWGLKAYVLLGAGQVTLDSRSGDDGFPGRDDFDAAQIGLGFLAPLGQSRRVGLFVEANRYFLDRDNDAPLTHIDLGVQYGF